MSGAKLREYHFARCLGQRGDLTFVYFSEPGMPAITAGDMPFAREIVSAPRVFGYTPMQLAQGLAGRWPLPVLNYTNEAMDAVIRRVAGGQKFDVIHADSIHMIRYARAASRLCGGKVVYNWHNIESEFMRRFSETVSSPAKRWYAGVTAGKLKRLELEILAEATGHIVCSEREREMVLAWAPGARVHVAENGVDTRQFAWNPQNVTDAKLLFVGSMAYPANIDAALHFARAVWPGIRAKIPAATLTFVGYSPPPEVRALAESDGIAVTGTVPDVRPYYSGALASIVPLRTGGGTRLKILEAMALGTPVISTELGAEGLQVTAGQDILIAPEDSPEVWVRHLTALMQPERRADLTRRGRALVESQYDWDAIGADLATTYAGWVREAA